MLKTLLAKKEHTRLQFEDQATDPNVCTLGIVLDTTISFSTIYPQIYYFLERLMIGLKQVKEEHPPVSFEYSVVLLKDTPELMLFSDEKSVSKNEDEILDAFSEIEFQGGSANGAEDLTSTVKLLLKHMRREEPDKGRKGIIILSDAMPKEQNGFTDLTEYTGLQFAYVFCGDNIYMPQFRIVDQHGQLSADEKHICIYSDITALLAETEEKEVQLVEKLVDEIYMRFTD